MSQDWIYCVLCGRKYDHATKMGHSKTTCNSCLVNNRRFEFKRRSIAYKGGRCENCGYCKSVRALTFHHIDPSTKSFGIANAHCRSWEVVQAELDKCIMLCANCHAEEHERLDLRTEYSKVWNKQKPSQASDICDGCGGKKTQRKNVKLCFKCTNAKLLSGMKIIWPNNEELHRLVWEMPTSKLASILRISDRAIGKRCQKLGIPKPPRGYWEKLVHDKA